MSVNIYDGTNLTPIAGKTVPMPYTPAPQSMIGDAWVTSHAYAIGDYCIDGNVLYKCKTAHTSSASNRPPYASYWDAVTVTSQFNYEKIAEITFSKSADTFTHDTTYHRYQCSKPSGSLAKIVQNNRVRMVTARGNNVAISSVEFKYSDIQQSNAMIILDSMVMPIFGSNSFIMVRLDIGSSETNNLSISIGDDWYANIDKVKILIYA